MELFYFPCSNSVAYDHYINTVKKELNVSDIASVIDTATADEIKEKVGDKFRLCGVTSGENNQQSWNMLNVDDLVVFYREKQIIASCKVRYKLDNEEVAKKLWGVKDDGSTWKLLVFLDTFEERDIPSLKPDGTLLMYQGFSRVADEGNKNNVLKALNMPVSSTSPVHIVSSPKKETSLEGIIDKALEKNKQVVLTGAPGTGKTFGARKYVEKHISKDIQCKFIQFHPSYDYSDFVEGLRPIILEGSSSDDPTFVRLDGTFKSFCRLIVENNFKEQTRKKVSDVTFDEFKERYAEDEKKGKFKTKYYLVIDEINRADLSKVFGELMFGLEESYRGILNPIKTQYKNLFTYSINSNGKGVLLDFDVFKEGFFVPTNLYIVGTMNDIDKSVEAFDFALRRRFEWIDIKASDVLKSSLQEMFPSTSAATIDELVRRINAMNEVISSDEWKFGLSDAYHIGHAYFKTIDTGDLSSLNKVFAMNIVPLLKEYTRGRDPSSVAEFIKKCAEALEVSY